MIARLIFSGRARRAPCLSADRIKLQDNHLHRLSYPSPLLRCANLVNGLSLQLQCARPTPERTIERHPGGLYQMKTLLDKVPSKAPYGAGKMVRILGPRFSNRLFHRTPRRTLRFESHGT